jgi:hypothetical protein
MRRALNVRRRSWGRILTCVDAELGPVYGRLRQLIPTSVKLAVEEMKVPVLDPGCRRWSARMQNRS